MHPHFVPKSNVWSPAPITAINEFLFICSLWMITAGLLGYFCQNISLKFFPLLLTKSLIKTQFSTDLKVLKSDCVGEYMLLLKFVIPMVFPISSVVPIHHNKMVLWKENTDT